MDETPIYDSIQRVIEAIQNGDIEPSEVTVSVDNDYSEAVRENPDDFNHEHPESIVDEEFVNFQLLARDEKLPYATLVDVLETLDIQTKQP